VILHHIQNTGVLNHTTIKTLRPKLLIGNLLDSGLLYSVSAAEQFMSSSKEVTLWNDLKNSKWEIWGTFL
jgi:hypothetical protein